MAMGITQALKLQAGPIDTLAKLPQQQLVQMAQQGRIPADVLPIILNEKAQMAQQAANMQAAQRPMPPSVIEQAMATNAQADAQNQPQMPPQLGGIADLPIPENMYGSEESYAGGGIVAFGPGGATSPWVEDESGFSTLREETGAIPSFGGMFSPAGATESINYIRSLLAPYKTRSAEEEDYFRKLKGPTDAEKSEARWMRALEAGLGIMGGESPYAFTNIGKGTQAAAKGYAEDVKEQRKAEMAALQARADMARREREGQAADVTTGLGLYQHLRGQELKEKELASREEQGRLDRENRMAIAQIPDKALQVAAKLMKDNPSLSYLDAVSQASQALSPKDTYNATRTAVSAAAKDANAEFTARLAFDPKLQEDMKKAAAGDAAAQERVRAIKNKIQQDTFRLYQVEGVDLSSGKMGGTTANDPLGIRR